LEIENSIVESNLQVGQEPRYTLARREAEEEQQMRGEIGGWSFHCALCLDSRLWWQEAFTSKSALEVAHHHVMRCPLACISCRKSFER
jgi:hypothetical protein